LATRRLNTAYATQLGPNSDSQLVGAGCAGRRGDLRPAQWAVQSCPVVCSSTQTATVVQSPYRLISVDNVNESVHILKKMAPKRGFRAIYLLHHFWRRHH